MKRNVSLILILFLIVISCNKDDIKYSCDPQIDMIVKSGVSEFSGIGLKEFLETISNCKRPSIAVFQIQKKLVFGQKNWIQLYTMWRLL